MNSKCNAVSDCKGYHHGDLRNALIIAAGELIEEKGSLDFSMVEAARKAKVSSAAPYRHFKDKDALLEAVCDVALLALNEVMREVVASHQWGSSQCLIAMGHAYIRFVTDHPQFFDLMWGDQGKYHRDPDDPELKHSAFFVFVAAVNTWCEEAGLRGYDPLELAVKMWANAHGLASLSMHENIKLFIPEVDIYALFASSANTFLDGLRQKAS